MSGAAGPGTVGCMSEGEAERGAVPGTDRSAAGGADVRDWTGRPAWFVLNESFAFLVELAAFAALCWWGLRAGGTLLAVVTPLAAMVVWGMFAAPRAKYTLPLAGVLLVKAVVLGGGVVVLWAAGRPGWAIALAMIAVVNTTLAEAGRRQPRHTAA